MAPAARRSRSPSSTPSSRYYRESNANHGGAFATSERSDAIVDDAHAALADLLGVDADEITLGPNMTTLTFHVSRSIAATLRPGDEIVITGLDHQANVDPWIAAARDSEAIVRTWEPHLDDCTLRLEDLDAVLNERTRLVAVGWASNAVGTINPIAEIAEPGARRRGAGSSSTRSTPRRTSPLDARAVDADFVACSVYKFFGPHLGALYGRREIMESLPAYKVRPAAHRFETGTGNFEGDAGARRRGRVPRRPRRPIRRRGATASRGASACSPGCTRSAPTSWTCTATSPRGLAAIDGVRILGLTADADMERRTPTAAITIEGVTPHDAAVALGRAGHRRLGRRLLRDRAHRAARARARRRRPHRPDPLQHPRRGRPARRRDRDARGRDGAPRPMPAGLGITVRPDAALASAGEPHVRRPEQRPRRSARRCSRRPGPRSGARSTIPPTASSIPATSTSPSASTRPSRASSHRSAPRSTCSTPRRTARTSCTPSTRC